MAMIRRGFLALISGYILAAITPAWVTDGSMLPRRCLEACRAKRYPGPLAPLIDEAVKKPGKWAG